MKLKKFLKVSMLIRAESFLANSVFYRSQTRARFFESFLEKSSLSFERISLSSSCTCLSSFSNLRSRIILSLDCPVPLGCRLRDNLRNHSYRGKQLARDQAKDHELSKTCRLLVDGTKHRKRLLLDHCCLAVQYMCRIDRVKHLVVELLGAVSV
jgi:hypothetical protein